MKRKNLLILVGAPGCGKTTWAQEYLKNNPNGYYISRDKVRLSIIGNEDYYFVAEDQVFREFCNMICEAIYGEYDYVIADATHLNQRSRDKLLRGIGAAAHTVNLIAVKFNTSLDTCLKRNAKREGRCCVPKSAIVRMFRSMTDPATDHRTYSKIWYINEKGVKINEK